MQFVTDAYYLSSLKNKPDLVHVSHHVINGMAAFLFFCKFTQICLNDQSMAIELTIFFNFFICKLYYSMAQRYNLLPLDDQWVQRTGKYIRDLVMSLNYKILSNWYLFSIIP